MRPGVIAVFRAAITVVALLLFGACSRDAPPAARSPGASRSPDVVRRDGNHLANAGSAYLRAHGHDPVDWYPWGPEALGRAKAENKPIFLSVGYVACHWCHVMQHEVFSQDDVATLLNDRFVSIKVDREERPDLDRVYLEALEAMGRSGGWPATLFLTPALEPFFGATYLPKDRFLGIATEAAIAYASGSSDLKAATAAFHATLVTKEPETAQRLSAEEIRAAATGALERVDLARGGFKGTAKFPLASRWRFLLHAYRKWGGGDLAAALRVTLDAMAKGALHDPVGGGFHRYTVDPTWSTPHFEEMLYDNAQLASLYLEAGAALGQPAWLQVARETLDFIADDMTTASGAFAASFDADVHGVEGAPWTWSRAELEAVLGKEDGAAAAAALDVREGPARAPTLRGGPDATWTAARPRLRAARSGRANRDDKEVTAWNGLAITALAEGFAATANRSWLLAAQRAGETLWRTHHEQPGHLVHTASDPPTNAVLEDYACLAQGYLALFEAGGEVAWLDRATKLVAEARAQLAAPTGAFFASDVPAPFVRTVALDDGAEPAGNAVMLHVLQRLASLDARGADWRALTTRALEAYAGALRERGLGMAGWLDVALLDGGPFYDLVVAGAPSSRAPADDVVQRLAAPWVVRVNLPADGAESALRDRLDGLEGKTAGHDPLRAFVCERGACKKPTSDPTELRAQLLAGWKQ